MHRRAVSAKSSARYGEALTRRKSLMERYLNLAVDAETMKNNRRQNMRLEKQTKLAILVALGARLAHMEKTAHVRFKLVFCMYLTPLYI